MHHMYVSVPSSFSYGMHGPGAIGYGTRGTFTSA